LVNERRRKQVILKLQRELHTLRDKRIALLGLSFKPSTDDLREAPSLEIAGLLDTLGARVVGYDPVATKKAASTSPGSMTVAYDPYEALGEAHAAVIVTEWEKFRDLDLDNALDPKEVWAAGICYAGFGRG
jgi:UDPglucose 6-dehydrogenase